MSELPGLPPRPHRDGPLPPGGLEQALTEGRRRRNRALTAVAGAAAVVALAVPAVGLLPTGGADRLVPADEPGRTATTTPVPTSSPGPRQPVAYREDTDEAAPGGGTCRPGSDGGDATCGYTGGTADGTVLRAGDTAVLVLGYCLPRDAAADRVLPFSSGQEKDLVVRDAAGAEAYRFSETVRFVEGAHDRELRRGRCVEWSAAWDLTTTDGAPAGAGAYSLTLEVRGTSEDPPLPAEVTVGVTVA